MRLFNFNDEFHSDLENGLPVNEAGHLYNLQYIKEENKEPQIINTFGENCSLFSNEILLHVILWVWYMFFLCYFSFGYIQFCLWVLFSFSVSPSMCFCFHFLLVIATPSVPLPDYCLCHISKDYRVFWFWLLPVWDYECYFCLYLFIYLPTVCAWVHDVCWHFHAKHILLSLIIMHILFSLSISPSFALLKFQTLKAHFCAQTHAVDLTCWHTCVWLMDAWTPFLFHILVFRIALAMQNGHPNNWLQIAWSLQDRLGLHKLCSWQTVCISTITA